MDSSKPVQSGIATAMPSTQLFASPLRFDDQWKPQPYLAESWKLAEDGKSLTLNLRKNAVFHDGKPITSADVAFSIMAIKANHRAVQVARRLRRADDEGAALLRRFLGLRGQQCGCGDGEQSGQRVASNRLADRHLCCSGDGVG